MVIVCSISGHHPDEPVLVPSTGLIFEKRLLEKHLKANDSKCPVTNTSINIEDVVEVKTSKAVRPRPPAASSVPGMLTLLQSEWDTVMIEAYELRAHLDQVRSQLSHALYQHDAACRCIARLTRERDTARNQVTQLQQQLVNLQSKVAVGGTTDAVAVETGIPAEVMDEISEAAAKLCQGRKKRAIQGLAPVEKWAGAKQTGTYPLHEAAANQVGVTDLRIHINDSVNGYSPILLSSGVDGSAILFDLEGQKTISRLVGHTRRVTASMLHPSLPLVATASTDKTARVFAGTHSAATGKLVFKPAHVFRTHTKDVVSLSLHPLGGLVATSGLDSMWAVHDVESGRTLKSLRNLPTNYTRVRFHPDGVILGASGADGNVHIWDVRSLDCKAKLEVSKKEVTDLSFSENGYYLSTSDETGKVMLWDLRKSSTFQSFDIDTSGAATFTQFDHSGQYFICGSESGVVQVYNFESRANAVKAFECTVETPASSGVFGPLANWICASSSKDSTVKQWSAVQE